MDIIIWIGALGVAYYLGFITRKNRSKTPPQKKYPKCPQCGGEFGPWRKLGATKWSILTGNYDTYVQGHECLNCNYFEHRDM